MTTTTGVEPKYRSTIKELLEAKAFMGEGGLETTLIFEKGYDLSCFASFTALLDDKTRAEVDAWQVTFFNNAASFGCGYWLDTKTWRANPDYAEKVGVDMPKVWQLCLDFSFDFRKRYETKETPIVVSGCIGPRRDGYRLDEGIVRTVEDARDYHLPQIKAFERGGADVMTTYTMNHFEEPAGIALACKSVGMPVVISFTVETDGKLASGETLASVIKRIDDISGNYPLFYMINCAHPSHMLHGLEEPSIAGRIKGFFPNSSKKSHAELDESTTLDRGEPDKLGLELFSILTKNGYNPRIVGGCCGTDKEHVCVIGKAFRDFRDAKATPKRSKADVSS